LLYGCLCCLESTPGEKAAPWVADMTLSTAHIIERLAIPDFDVTAILFAAQGPRITGVEEENLFSVFVRKD